jgi:addiction module HigA family antidote
MTRKMRNIHPGEIFREEVLNANNLTVTEAAKLLGVSRPNLSNIVNEKSDISSEMAIRISVVFGGTPEIWANLQTKYNLRKAAEKMKDYQLKPFSPVDHHMA